MKIECKLKREGGTKAEIEGVVYHFAPQEDGAHVAEVLKESHQDRFLSISEAYRLYRDKGQVQPALLKPDIAITLLGSNVHPTTFDINGKTVQLGDVVALAHVDAGLSAEDWNGLSDEARADLIDEQLDKMQAEAGTQGAEDELAELRTQYQAKFGKKPHHKWSADKIREELAA